MTFSPVASFTRGISSPSTLALLAPLLGPLPVAVSSTSIEPSLSPLSCDPPRPRTLSKAKGSTIGRDWGREELGVPPTGPDEGGKPGDDIVDAFYHLDMYVLRAIAVQYEIDQCSSSWTTAAML